MCDNNSNASNHSKENSNLEFGTASDEIQYQHVVPATPISGQSGVPPTPVPMVTPIRSGLN